jgi:hypothetical protein
MVISLPLCQQSKEKNIEGSTCTNFSPISQFGKCHSPVVAVGWYGWDRVIAYKSKYQSTIALSSTTEAEFTAAAEANKITLYL